MSYEDYQHWKNTPIDGEPYLSIVIPAYNEEVRIVPTIGAIAAHISGLGFPWELLISDDGSKDATVTFVEGLGLANLHVIRAPQNEGKGSAVRRVMSGGLHYIVANIFRIGVRDTQCGFKMFTRDAAHHLYRAQTINGFSFDLEILYLADKLGYKIAEIPVAWVDAPGSKVDPAPYPRNTIRQVRQFSSTHRWPAYARKRQIKHSRVKFMPHLYYWLKMTLLCNL